MYTHSEDSNRATAPAIGEEITTLAGGTCNAGPGNSPDALSSRLPEPGTHAYFLAVRKQAEAATETRFRQNLRPGFLPDGTPVFFCKGIDPTTGAPYWRRRDLTQQDQALRGARSTAISQVCGRTRTKIEIVDENAGTLLVTEIKLPRGAIVRFDRLNRYFARCFAIRENPEIFDKDGAEVRLRNQMGLSLDERVVASKIRDLAELPDRGTTAQEIRRSVGIQVRVLRSR